MPYEDYTPLAFANVPEFGDARGELRPADAMTETIVPTLGNMVFTLGGRTKVGLPLRPCAAPGPAPALRQAREAPRRADRAGRQVHVVPGGRRWRAPARQQRVDRRL
jgi:hypothetical protein